MPDRVPGSDDTRGIVDPAFMRTIVSLERYPPGEQLQGLVDWFWAVAWALPAGAEHVQQVLTHPASQLSVGTVDRAGRVLAPAGARIYGVRTEIDSRRLVGRGWTVAARTSGGVLALTGTPARAFIDAEVPLADALDVPDVALRVEGAGEEVERVAELRRVLERVVERRDAAVLAQAREVTAAAALIERDRSLVRIEQVATAVGVGVRTLQRMFSQHLGVSPAWVIRRWRVVEAADRANRGEVVVWADLAAELGYADQAHLVRSFRAHLGTTPSAYTRGLSSRAPAQG